MSLTAIPNNSSCVREFPCRKISKATRFASLPPCFSMRRGGVLRNAQVAYETWGQLNAQRDNAILIFTGLSPSAHASSSLDDPQAGWWEFMIGPGRPIDTQQFFVICVNSLGSCFGSTGPASMDPDTNKTYRLNFPELCIEDIAEAGWWVLQSLDIEFPLSVVGTSLGGMTALAYAMHHPCQSLVSLCSAAQATPFAIAIRSMQREMIRNDPDWEKGNYRMNNGPNNGMAMARKLGVTSYRSAEEWQTRFGRQRRQPTSSPSSFGIEFEIESYLDHQGKKFVGSFDANCYLYLSRATDWFDVSEHGGSIYQGLHRINANHILVSGVKSDILFPIEQQQELADTFTDLGKKVQFHALPSLQGHDAFLIDEARFSPIMRRFMESLY